MQLRILFLYFIACWCACPNNCSGHGKCNSDGSCSCYKQTGLALNGAYFNEFTYTGPDCSLRTCPKAFGFSSKPDIDEWYKNAGPEFTMTKVGDCGETGDSYKCGVNLPNVSYIEVLEVSAIDPALEDYSLGGSMSCYAKSSKRLFRKAYTILNYSKNYLYGILDIDSEETEEKEQLYCYIDYIRKDLSLFVNFQLSKTNSKGEVTLRHDLSMILTNYLFNSNEIPIPTTTPTTTPLPDDKKLDVKIGCIKSESSEVIQYTGKLYGVKCVTNTNQCIKIETESLNNNGVNDKCFLLEGGYSHKYNIRRNVTLEASEIYHLMGKVEGKYYLGKNNYESALGYFVPSGLASEDNLGTVITDANTFDPTEVYNELNDTVIIDFSKSCPGLNCYKNMKPDESLKSFGEFFQYISYGAHVNVIRLITTREVEDKSGVGVTATPSGGGDSTIWVEDHGCYAHLVQLTIRDYKIVEAGKGKVQLFFNRPYHFNSESSHNHYSYLFQFVGDGSHVPVECSGVGECDRTTGQCQCLPGFDGDACQRISCPNNCNDKGRCVSTTELYNDKDKEYEGFGTSNSFGEARLMACKCDKGFRGPDCSLKECPSSKNGLDSYHIDCSGRGICDYNTGLCTCFDGYTGNGCETAREYN